MSITYNKSEYKYINYEDCEKIAPKKVIKKFEHEIIFSKNAPRGPLPVIGVFDNVIGSFNLPRSIRTCNVLGAQEVFVIGTKFINPYPAVGAVKHTRINFFDTWEEAYQKLLKLNYKIYAMFPPKPAIKDKLISIWDIKLSKDLKEYKGIAIVVGNEDKGLPFDILSLKNTQAIYIPQRGIVESLNVSVAFSIAIAEIDRQYRQLKKKINK